MASRIQPKKLPIVAILAPEVIKGYIFVEAMGPHFVDEAIAGTRHARTRTKGVVSLAAIERFIVTKPVIEELSVGNLDRKSTRLNSSHVKISYAVFCLKKKKD